MIDTASGQSDRIKNIFRLLKSFTDSFRIVSRANIGKSRLRPEKELKIERDVVKVLESCSEFC